MKYLAIALILMASGCVTTTNFDYSQATETVEFVDTVLTVLENRGLSLNAIMNDVLEIIQEARHGNPEYTVNDIVSLVLKDLKT